MENINSIVLISSWMPRFCSIASFASEAVEFLSKTLDNTRIYIISPTDGRGEDVFPIIDMSRDDWYIPVFEKIRELQPYIVHLQHDYSLYASYDTTKKDALSGFIELLKLLKNEHIPTVVELHSVHGRLREHEELFIREVTENTNVVLFKCAYQKWRLGWAFIRKGWDLPSNIMIVPHGVRPDRRYGPGDVPRLKIQLGLQNFINKHVVGLVGWIQNNKRWNLITDIWGELQDKIESTTGQEWCLLGAGTTRGITSVGGDDSPTSKLEIVERNGKVKFYEFIPNGEIDYQLLAICDFIILPSFDETHTSTLARIIALNKPYITTAPMEELTSQTVESKGGLLFSNIETLKDAITRLATNEPLRFMLGGNLKKYLQNVVSWENVVKKYIHAYQLASNEVRNKVPVTIPFNFKDISY